MLHSFNAVSLNIYGSWWSRIVKITAFMVFRIRPGDSEDTKTINRLVLVRSPGEGCENTE